MTTVKFEGEMCKEIDVSVVIPTYSRNESLSRAIDSVLQQTYQKIEVIVVDDNPPDSEWRKNSELIMKRYKNNKKIRYIQNPRNLGGSAARNVGVKEAIGEYVAFLDDDDEYLPERIEKQLSVFRESSNEKLALVYCHAKFINKDGGSTYSDKRNFHGNCLYEAMEQNCIAATSQWMVKKVALDSVGGFPIVPCKQDSQTILRLLKKGYEVEVVPEELSLYYLCDIGDRISGTSAKNIKGEELYRTECRKLYYLLEDWQILNVEYQFAQRFYALYKANHLVAQSAHEWEIMRKLNCKAAYIYRLKEIWHLLR